MTIQLSTITFTDEDDIVPLFEEDAIVNTDTANTLGGNDLITGTTITGSNNFGIWNSGTINTGAGHDIIIGICDENHPWIPNAAIRSDGGTINTDEGDDIIIGTSQTYDGIFIISGCTINTGDGNDQIIGSAIGSGINVNSQSIIDTGNGNDAITGIGSHGVSNHFIINTGDGDDKITGIGTIFNSGTMDTGAGNDEITGTSANTGISTSSDSIIDTGDGDDKITGTGNIGISNNGIIKTGNGQDSIIADGGFNGISGSVFLENDKDYLKGFGSGFFDGGDGEDTLELTSGSYIFWISAAGVAFIKNNITMRTVGFEKLIAGSTSYDFTSLTQGQTIIVA
jgi:hypothetical protein